jgi:hypothetical protein
LLLLAATLLASGCNGVRPQDYAGSEPELDLFAYFTGQTRAWGIFQSRGGELKRQFTVDIRGERSADNELVLTEDFVYRDGERSQRVWTITRHDEHNFTGRAGDVVGEARGERYGNALNWRYTLALEVDGSTWNVQFDDWMFQHEDGVLINRAEMSKFGFRLGEVTLFFQRVEG